MIQEWYNRPNTGRCTEWTLCHPTPRKLIIIMMICVLLGNANIKTLRYLERMPYSGILRRVAVGRTEFQRNIGFYKSHTA
jgi:hypothetical protein